VTAETVTDSFVWQVVQLVGYNTMPSDDIRDYVEQLRLKGYSAYGAARQLRTLLEINTL